MQTNHSFEPVLFNSFGMFMTVSPMYAPAYDSMMLVFDNSFKHSRDLIYKVCVFDLRVCVRVNPRQRSYL